MSKKKENIMGTIKFYSNFKNGKVFVSGKNEQEKWFSLWKNTEINEEMYLDNSKFKNGIEIEKSKLKLLDNEKDCKVLVFKNAEDEKEFCISKEEVENRKKQRQKSKKKIDDIYEHVKDLFVELFKNNEKLQAGVILTELLKEENEPEECEKIENDDDLPF